MKKLSAKAQEELDKLARKLEREKKPVRAQDVLQVAENEESALHGYFEWDDTEAAALYRLDQARQIIRVYVIRIERRPKPIRVFISPPSERIKTGGYRRTQKIMGNDCTEGLGKKSGEQGVNPRRLEMLQDAMQQAMLLRSRYTYLEELDRFFDEIDSVVKIWCNDLGIPHPRADKLEDTESDD